MSTGTAVAAAAAAPDPPPRGRRIYALLPMAALVLAFAILLPVVHAPFFGDDTTNSEVTGYAKLSGDSVIEVIADGTRSAVTKGGRPQVLGWLTYPPWLTIHDHPGLYHLYLVLLTIVDAGLLYLLLRRLGWGRASAAAPVVLAAAFMQLRLYHDPLLAYAGVMQVIFALTLCSALFFDRWLGGGRRRDLWFAIGLFAVCLLIYEVSYTFAAVHVALAFSRRRGRAAIRAAAPFVALSAVLVVTSWWLRQIAPAGGTGYLVGGGPWTALRTYFIQLFPPLPLTYIGFDPSIAGNPTPGEWLGAGWRALAVAGSVAALSLWAIRERATAVATTSVIGLGLALWLAPPALLSLTPKYQTELAPGKGYLPVLVQVFGVAILMTCGLRAVLTRALARSRGALLLTVVLAAGVTGLAAGATAFSNLRVLGMLQPERESRSLLEAGVERGAIAAAPARSSVLFWERDIGWSIGVNLNEVPWQTLMLAHRTGRRYDARIEYSATPDGPACPPTPAILQPQCAPVAAHAYWARARLRPDGGTVIVAPMTRGRPQRARPVAGEIRAYRQRNDGGRPSPPRLVGITARGRPWTSASVTWRRLDGGDDWSLYAGRLGSGPPPTASSLDDQRAMVDFAALPAPPSRVRLFGSRRLLP